MQLKMKLSLLACSILATSSLMAEEYVSIQYVHYDESDERATISSPSFEISKDFGVDYNVKVGLTADSISGASPTWYDATSSASEYSRGKDVHISDVAYGNKNYDDDRVAVSALLTTRFASRDELTLGMNYSKETDYEAKELSAQYLHYLDTGKNQSLSMGISYQSNTVDVVCYDNSICDASSGASGVGEDLDVISMELGFTQILDETSLAKASLFYTNEDGYLSNPYMNVVRGYSQNSDFVDIVAENKPDSRASYGVTLQYAVALNDRTSSNSSYRFYNDDWEISSHTISSELYYEINDEWLLGAGLRYYTQSEAEFYSNTFFSDEKYASSDERMRSFDAMGYKLNADYKVSETLHVNMGLNFYDQLDSFYATYYNIGLKYKF